MWRRTVFGKNFDFSAQSTFSISAKNAKYEIKIAFESLFDSLGYRQSRIRQVSNTLSGDLAYLSFHPIIRSLQVDHKLQLRANYNVNSVFNLNRHFSTNVTLKNIPKIPELRI